MKKTGIKKDGGKTQWSLVPWTEMELAVRVLMHGAKKYAPFNWQGLDRVRMLDALTRHVVARQQGEVLDKESGLPHLAHAVCEALFVMWHDNGDKP